VLGAMETGYQRGRIQDESMHYEMLKHTGELPIVGVNTFRNPHGDAVPSRRERDLGLPPLRSARERHRLPVGKSRTAPAVPLAAGSGHRQPAGSRWNADGRTRRTSAADASADADPNTGAAVYDSLRDRVLVLTADGALELDALSLAGEPAWSHLWTGPASDGSVAAIAVVLALLGWRRTALVWALALWGLAGVACGQNFFAIPGRNGVAE